MRNKSSTFNTFTDHDDVIKLKHFPRYWSFVRGIQRSPVNSPHKGQWRWALMFSLIWARTNDWVNNRDASDLRRYRAHYDVTVMAEWYIGAQDIIFFKLTPQWLVKFLRILRSFRLPFFTDVQSPIWFPKRTGPIRIRFIALKPCKMSDMQQTTYQIFSNYRPWISPWIKSISNELDVTIHVIASQLSGHCDVISNRLWRHQQNENRAGETRGRCVKLVVFIVYGFVMSCTK